MTKEWSGTKGIGKKLMRRRYSRRDMERLIIDELSRKGKLRKALMTITSGGNIDAWRPDQRPFNPVMDHMFKRKRWSRLEIVNLICDDIRQKGKIVSCICQDLGVEDGKKAAV